MKCTIVICVLIYFELVASYPYGEEYLEANRPPSERRLQFSNFAQPGPTDVPPGFYYQNRFKPETTKPYFGNVGAYRASNVPLETGSNLRPVQDQNYPVQDLNYPVQGQNYPGQKILPVQQLLPHQPGFSNEFLENQAKLSQFQPQYAAVPHLKVEDESYLNPVVTQYPSVNHVENIGNSAAFKPQYDQNLPSMNGPPSPRTINIQKSQNVPLKLEGLNSNIGFVQKNNAQDNNVLNLQNLDVAGNNNLQQLLHNTKLKEILATTKNKKRYMVIHPNGEIEHVDSIDRIAAQHPNHLVLNSAVIDQMTDTLRSSSLTSSNITPAPVRPLNSELSSQYPRQLDISNIFSHKPQPQDVPFKSNAPTSSVLLSSTRLPQLTESNISRPPAIPLVDISKPSPVLLPSVYPSQPELSSLPPNIPLKSSTVVQPIKIPSYSKNSLSSASPVVENAPVSLPLVTSTIPILKKSVSESIAKTSPDFTNPHASSKEKPANDLHLPQQLHLSAPLVSSDTEKAGSSPVSSPKLSQIDSTHPISSFPIETIPNAVLSPSKKMPMISSPQTPPVLVQNNKYIDNSKNSKAPHSTELYGESLSNEEPKIISSAAKIDVPEKSLPLTITEVNPTPLISSDHSSVITLSASENKSNQAIGSKDINTNYLTLEDKENDNNSLVELVSKPVAMVSPTPETISTPIELADLFPITKDDDENMVVLADSEVNKTTESTESLTTKSDSDTIDHAQSDKTATTTDDGKQTVTDADVNVSTSDIAHEEQRDENRKELEVINSNKSSTNYASHTTEIKSDKQTDSETVSDEDAQSESQAVYKNDKATSNLSSSLEEPSNLDAESLESKIPPIVVDTASPSFSSTGADESSPQLSSIIAVDESNDEKENVIRKKNMFLSTPPSYDEIWNKLLGDSAVTMVYFVQIPSQNKYVDEEVQEKA